MNNKIPMTLRGKERLDSELKDLIQVQRPAVIKAIEEARSHGDLSENADYDAAKERQGFIEARIGEIQHKLAMAEVIDPSKLQSDRVVFGATVLLEDCELGKEIQYQIVGADESDVKKGLLSVMSPLARGLIGKRKGDVVEVVSPSGAKGYEIIDFHFK